MLLDFWRHIIYLSESEICPNFFSVKGRALMAHFPQGSLLTTVPDSGGVSLSKRMKMKDDVDLLIKSQEKNTFKTKMFVTC